MFALICIKQKVVSCLDEKKNYRDLGSDPRQTLFAPLYSNVLLDVAFALCFKQKVVSCLDENNYQDLSSDPIQTLFAPLYTCSNVLLDVAFALCIKHSVG